MVTLRGRGKDQAERPLKRFLYMCYPTSNDRLLGEWTVSTEEERPTDKVLIGSIKEEYLSLRPPLMRLKCLRNFSAIRLARVSVTAYDSSLNN